MYKKFSLIILLASGLLYGMHKSSFMSFNMQDIDIYPGIQRTEVFMNDQKEINATPEEQQKKTIFTKDLTGCIALALIVKKQSGSKHVIMSHFALINQADQIRRLKIAFNKLYDQNDEIIDKHLIIVAPGEWVQDDNDKWIMKPHSYILKQIRMLEAVVDIKPVIAIYDEKHSNVQKLRDFKVELSPEKISWSYFNDHHIPHNI